MGNKKLSKLKVQVVEELARLNELNEGLRPSDVVEAAKPKDAPLHGEFLWDNGKAAHEYRLNQARTLIRVVVWSATRDDGTEVLDRYVHVPKSDNEEENDPDTNEGRYFPMSVVIKDVNKFSRALSELVTKVNAATKAAKELQEAASSAEGEDVSDRLMRISMAITALETASAAVASLH